MHGCSSIFLIHTNCFDMASKLIFCLLSAGQVGAIRLGISRALHNWESLLDIFVNYRLILIYFNN
jgi:hypothetical protein